jgi:hypothetical protein
MSGRAGDSRCGGCELGAAACDEAKLESENHITSERQGSQLLVSPNHHSISSSLLQSQLKRHERPSGPAREVGGLGLSVRRMDCCCPGSLVNPAAIPAHLTLASWAAEPAVRAPSPSWWQGCGLRAGPRAALVGIVQTTNTARLKNYDLITTRKCAHCLTEPYRILHEHQNTTTSMNGP